MYSKIIHIGELTDNDKKVLEDLANIPCSNIECVHCPLQVYISVKTSDKVCLRELAHQALSK